MHGTKRYLLQLRAQFEREGSRQKLLGFIWLSPQQRYEILKEILFPIAEHHAR